MTGGIAAVNTGKITDCYAIWNEKNDNQTLIAKNCGTVLTSMLVQKGECRGVFDGNGAFYNDYAVQKTSDIKNLGFDTKQCWEYVGNDTLLKFNSNYWHSVCRDIEKRFIFHIKTVEEYMVFAERVNAGDEKYLTARVLLEGDLDFKGRKIPIVGIKKECAFAGIFDGQDHMIWNGIIQDDQAIYAGLFGYLKGTVVNVIFDGRVKGSGNLAGLCGYNAGNIDCCGTVIRICAKDERCHVGGLVAYNEGVVRRSYTLFERKRAVPPILLVFLTAMFFVSMGSLGYCTIATAMDTGKEYATIEVDPGQERADEGTTEEVNKDGSNSISFTFNQTVVISRSAGTCKLDFINPANDSNKIVVELQIVNAAGERVTIAQSKAILPGYKIESLNFNESAYELITGAETEGYVMLVPYDSKTEAKAVVQTELPVSIVFEN